MNTNQHEIGKLNAQLATMTDGDEATELNTFKERKVNKSFAIKRVLVHSGEYWPAISRYRRRHGDDVVIERFARPHRSQWPSATVAANYGLRPTSIAAFGGRSRASIAVDIGLWAPLPQIAGLRSIEPESAWSPSIRPHAVAADHGLRPPSIVPFDGGADRGCAWRLAAPPPTVDTAHGCHSG